MISSDGNAGGGCCRAAVQPGQQQGGGFVVRCGDVQLAPGEHERLTCRFSNNTEVPAEYDEELQCVLCRPSAGKFGGSDPATSGLSYDVVGDGNKTLLQRLLAESEVARWEQLKMEPGSYDAPQPEDANRLGGKVSGDLAGEEGAGAIGEPDGDGGGAAPPKKRGGGALRPFIIISIAYLLYTVTDGAIRMIVLFHAYAKGFSAMEVAIMFSMYELAGVATNFLAGIAGARWGIRSTLIAGLLLQLAGIGMLYGWQDGWSKTEAIVYVTAAQMLCGIAKDLTKLGGKTVTKLVTPDEKQAKLFKLVSFITGFKNSLKGAGYFLGSVLIIVSYYVALSVLMGIIGVALPFAIFGLRKDLGRTRKENISVSAIFRKNHNTNTLSLSRMFLFGSRDLWFEVPLPFFMRDAVYGLGWGRASVGAALAIFIILYGQVQSWTPQVITKPLRQVPPNKWAATLWCAILSVVPTYMGIVLMTPLFDANEDSGPRVAVLLPGLALFAFVFAVNSSIHSYLIVRYSEGDKVAMNVGFYYMSNAVGRLVGTLMSGALYSYVGSDISVGFAACFLASLCFAVASACVDVFIHDNKGGLSCGPCLSCFGGGVLADDDGAAKTPGFPPATQGGGDEPVGGSVAGEVVAAQ